MRTFHEYVLQEDRGAVRRLKSNLLRALGYDVKLTQAQGGSPLGVKIGEMDQAGLTDKLGRMGLDREKVSQLQNWVAGNPGSTLQDLMNQLDGPDDDGDVPLPSQKAILPNNIPGGDIMGHGTPSDEGMPRQR